MNPLFTVYMPENGYTFVRFCDCDFLSFSIANSNDVEVLDLDTLRKEEPP